MGPLHRYVLSGDSRRAGRTWTSLASCQTSVRVVAKILYNFYLTNHVTNLNLNCDTCLDIGTNAMVESEE